MHYFVLCTVFFVLAAFPALASVKIDMANGDSLSGRLVAEDGKYLVIGTDYGMVKLPKAQIAARSDVAIEAAPAEIVAIEPAAGEMEEPTTFGATWSGRANFGASLQQGNTEKNAVNADGRIAARWPSHRYEIRVDYNREKDEGDITEDNASLANRYDYFYSDQWFLNATARFEQDDIEQLDLRQVYGAGLGYQPFDRKDLKLKMSLGPSYIREEFESGKEFKPNKADWLDGKWSHLDRNKDDYQRLFHDNNLFRNINNQIGCVSAKFGFEVRKVCVTRKKFDLKTASANGITGK